MDTQIIKWNQIIGDYYFNNNISDTEISLDIDVDVLKEIFGNDYPNTEGLLNRYASLLKRKGSYIQTFKHELKKWKHLSFEEKGNSYPCFLYCLSSFFIPFSSGITHEDLNINNFYDVFYDFWEDYELFENRHRNLLQNFYPDVWRFLEEWLNEIWDGERGLYFFEEERDGRGINYVNKVFEHIALRKQSILNLPQFFNQQGILPQTFISNESWIKYLKNDTYNFLRIPQSIRSNLSVSDKLTLRVINKIKNYHKNWNGFVRETQSITDNTNINNKTIARFRLCLEIEEDPFEETIELNNTYFRLYSESGIIKNLGFKHIKIEKEREKWSKKINNYNPSFGIDIIEQDNDNNWVFKYSWSFPIILIRGNRMGLSHWVEVSEIEDINQEAIFIFKRHGRSKLLYEIKNIRSSIRVSTPNNNQHYICYKTSLKNINLDLLKDEVDVSSIPKIYIHDKLSMDKGRTFFNRFLPRFSIANRNENDEVYLEFGNDEIVELIKREYEGQILFEISGNEKNINRFKIRSLDIRPSKGFFSIKNFKVLDFNEPSWKFDNKAQITQGQKYTAVDFLIENHDDDFIKLIKKENIKLDKHGIWLAYYQINTFSNLNNSDISKYCMVVNTLIEYLSTKRLIDFQEYKRAYEIISNRFFSKIDGEQRLLNRKKCFYSMRALGFIEANFEERKIYVNAPFLIRIPNDHGVRYLLTGARSFDLVKQLFQKIKPEKKLAIDVVEKEVKELMLPQSIFIKGISENDNKQIIDIANDLNIQIPETIVQEAYFNFSQKVEDFEDEVMKQNPNKLRYSGGRYFCIEELKFKPIIENLNRYENLITYTLDYGSFITILGIQKHEYEVDKNYGIFYMLYKKRKNVILYDHKRSYLALPATIHFPFYIDRGLTLLSGYLPEWKFIQNAPLKSRKYNIYTKVTIGVAKNIATSLGQNLITQEIIKS